MKHELDTLLDIEDSDYRAIDAISQSGMRMYATDGPYAYYCRVVAKTHFTPVSKAMELGRAGHRFLETGCNVEKVFSVNPAKCVDAKIMETINDELTEAKSSAKQLKLGDKLDNRTKSHRLYKEMAQKDVDPELVVVDEDKLTMFKESVQSMYDSEVCRNILLNGEYQCEMSIVRNNQGIHFKCQADVLKGSRIIDYKFTKHRNPSRWKKDAKYDGSFFQALYYMRLFDRPRFTWLLICNQPPHEAFAVTITREALESDHSTVAQYCEELGCKKSISSIADKTLQDMIDSYNCNVWHPDSWYHESDVDEAGW